MQQAICQEGSGVVQILFCATAAAVSNYDDSNLSCRNLGGRQDTS